jgi:hypothetical protein
VSFSLHKIGTQLKKKERSMDDIESIREYNITMSRRYGKMKEVLEQETILNSLKQELLEIEFELLRYNAQITIEIFNRFGVDTDKV